MTRRSACLLVANSGNGLLVFAAFPLWYPEMPGSLAACLCGFVFSVFADKSLSLFGDFSGAKRANGLAFVGKTVACAAWFSISRYRIFVCAAWISISRYRKYRDIWKWVRYGYRRKPISRYFDISKYRTTLVGAGFLSFSRSKMASQRGL